MIDRMRVAVLALAAGLVPLSAGLAVEPGQQNRLLSAIDAPAFPGIGAWMVDDLSVRVADGVEPRIGVAAIQISGQSRTPGGKVDAPAFGGELSGVRELAVWVHAAENANAASVGFQIVDARGEWLMQTTPIDWTGWKRISIAPSAGAMQQAYQQADHDGKVDFPIKSVHLVWFAREQGPTSLVFDSLSAITDARNGDSGVHIVPAAANVIDAGKPLALRLVTENRDAEARNVTVRYTLQANSNYIEPPLPDPVLGFDHALGAKATVTVDGEDRGDPKFTDGDEHTGHDVPWGKGYKEVVATVDLGQARNLRAFKWHAGDANWIFKVDVLSSLDGSNFAPVDGAQGIDMHKKWGGPHTFSFPTSVNARYVRFRFHKDGESTNSFRLPPTIMLFDGIENDVVEIPSVGEVVASGQVQADVAPRDFAELSATSDKVLGPGAYLLGLETTINGKTTATWSPMLVLPTDEVNPDRARRFGINSSDPSRWMAENMRRAGFGYVRFENAKWMMYMPSPDGVAFDGSVGPWHVNHDAILSGYQSVGMHVLPYVFQVPTWAQNAPEGAKNPYNYPPKNNADYGEAIFQIVARYGNNKVDPSLLKSDDKKTGLGWINAVELWNEPNLNDPGWGPWVGTMEQYFETMRAGVEGARRADPKLPVTSAGWAGINLETVGQMAEYKYADGKTPLDLVDVINVHFYSGRDEPEIAGWDPNVDRSGPSASSRTYPAQIDDLVNWRNTLKPSAQIWLTETGNDVGGPIGRSERHQAAKLPRGIMIALARGIDKVFIYREKGSDPSMHAGAGLLRNDNSIRPSWLTVATMIRQLQGFEGSALRLHSDDENVWMLLWQDGSRRLIAAWTIGQDTKFPLADLGKATVTDAFGNATKVDSTADITLGYFPKYILLDGPSDVFTKAVEDAQSRQAEREARQKKLAALQVHLFDFGPSTHVGMLKGYGLPRRFTPVGKDVTWDESRGYGFVGPGGSDEDARWIPDPLERDGVRLGPGHPFRFRLPPGKYTLTARAISVRADNAVNVAIKNGNETLTIPNTKAGPTTSITIEATNEPLEASIDDWGTLRWITAIPIVE